MAREYLRYFTDVSCLRAFLPLHDLEFDLITFLQALIAFRGDRAIVHKDVRSIVASNKTVAFGIVEPFHNTFQTFHLRPPRARSLPLRGRALLITYILGLTGITVKKLDRKNPFIYAVFVPYFATPAIARRKWSSHHESGRSAPCGPYPPAETNVSG